jgi:hypothetical protein
MDSTIELLKILPGYIQALAVIIAGGWAYRKFIYQRQQEPATDIDIDLRFIGIQDNQWVIEVTSFLENKSLVRVSYEDFQISIRYLLPDDRVEDGDRTILHQLNFPRTIDERIKAKRFFGNVDYLNPKQQFKHRYITSIPGNATFAWVQCKFFFKIGRRKIKSNSERIFRVPAKEDR